MLRRRERDLNKRTPLRTLGLSDQRHLRLARQSIALARITWNTRAHHIFPGGGSATVAWHDVVKVQIVAIEKMTAVLAGVLVPLENVVPGKFDLLLGKSIEKEQHDDTRNANLERNRRDQFMIGSIGRKISPAFKIVGQKIIRLI